MYFWLGMLFEEYKNFFHKKMCLYIIILFTLAFILYAPTSILGIKYFPCFILSLPVFIILYQIKIKHIFIQYICKYNYELYLVHHRIYILLLPALLSNSSNGYQKFIASIFVLYVSCLLAEALQTISMYSIDKINKIISFLSNYKVLILKK